MITSSSLWNSMSSSSIVRSRNRLIRLPDGLIRPVLLRPLVLRWYEWLTLSKSLCLINRSMTSTMRRDRLRALYLLPTSQCFAPRAIPVHRRGSSLYETYWSTSTCLRCLYRSVLPRLFERPLIIACSSGVKALKTFSVKSITSLWSDHTWTSKGRLCHGSIFTIQSFTFIRLNNLIVKQHQWQH